MTIAERIASVLRAAIPPRIWNRITRPYRDWRYGQRIRGSWLTRQDTVDGHVGVYWNSLAHPNRLRLVDTVAKYIADHDREALLGILEFGCHAGMNFRLLNDRFAGRPIRYYGVEPNHDVSSFLRKELPFVELLEAEDTGFVENKQFPPPGAVQISLINVVLYSVRAERAKRVIGKLCEISEIVILGEQLSNRGDATRFEQDPELYVHPYASWLRGFGFEEVEAVPAPEASPQFSGFLVARRRQREPG